ncbi:MAG TPA: hypothetical protein VIC33_05065 [Vicinamibacterales bacterium]
MLPPLQVTLPTPWSIEQLVAFVMPLQESVDDCPLVTVDGDASNEPMSGMGGGGAAPTATLAVALTVPPAPVAVSV